MLRGSGARGVREARCDFEYRHDASIRTAGETEVMYNAMYMARMVRKQIYITQEQNERLKREAAKRRVSEAEVIRYGIEAAGSVPSRRAEAWQDELAFIAQRAEQMPDLKKRRTWTREELYEDRLGRTPR